MCPFKIYFQTIFLISSFISCTLQANFGTSAIPYLHNIMQNISTCIVTIVFSKRNSENLHFTTNTLQRVPITLYQRNNISRPSQNFLRLRCIFLITYIKTNKNFTKDFSTDIAIDFVKSINYKLGPAISQTSNTFAYVILIAQVSKRELKMQINFPIYNPYILGGILSDEYENKYILEHF
jgi:hypothetical protein